MWLLTGSTLPGPLGAVEELDEVRTTFDGSIGNQNAHIQNNKEIAQPATMQTT